VAWATLRCLIDAQIETAHRSGKSWKKATENRSTAASLMVMECVRRRGPMRFYNRPHPHYCGIDLHVKTMYVFIVDAAGQMLVHRHVKSTPEAFLEIVASYRDDLVVSAERKLTWSLLASASLKASPSYWAKRSR